MNPRSATFPLLAVVVAVLVALVLGCSGGNTSSATPRTSGEATVPGSPASQSPAAEPKTPVVENPVEEPSVAEMATPLAPIAALAAADEPAIEPAATGTPPASTPGATLEKPASAAAAADGKIVVPEGTPEELLKFLDGLQSRQPSAQDESSIRAFATELGQALLTATDRILAAKPTEEQASQAVQYRLGGLGLLERAGDKSVAEKRAALPGQLQAAGFGSLVRQVELAGLFTRFQSLGAATKEAYASFAEDLAAFFEKTPPRPEEAELAMYVAGILEQRLPPKDAAAYCERVGKAFTALKDEQSVQIGAMMAGAARRIQLVGNPMPLDGVTPDGKTFDWNAYRGKVVLVDFWATWCGPCLEEMKNILDNYEKYHASGFDVVGISVDQDRGALVSFLKDNELPWTVLVDQDLQKAKQETMAVRYGISGIPNVTLVGKDGKVIATNPRGPELGEKLAELLGEPNPPAAAEKTPEGPAEKKVDLPKPEDS